MAKKKPPGKTIRLKGGILVHNVSGKDYYEIKYGDAIRRSKGNEYEAKLFQSMNIRSGNYSLRAQIKNHKWVKAGRPSTHATIWLYKTVFKQAKVYMYNRAYFEAGHLYIFNYFNPKYKNNLSVLPWFDRYPLVLGLACKITNKGIRNIGFNLHLLPPPIRIIVLCSVFEMYKRLYRYHIYQNLNQAIPIQYWRIAKELEKYGVLFSMRMYIPARQQQKVKFPLKEWRNAIFIPSRGYERIRAKKLIQEWHEYCKNNGISISPNIDWKTII
jgi:hypothetical protein